MHISGGFVRSGSSLDTCLAKVAGVVKLTVSNRMLETDGHRHLSLVINNNYLMAGGSQEIKNANRC